MTATCSTCTLEIRARLSISTAPRRVTTSGTDPDGAIVGLTILNAKLLLGKDGEIVVTLPEQTIRMGDLGDVLAAA